MKRNIFTLSVTLILFILLSPVGFAAEQTENIVEYQSGDIRIIQVQNSFENFGVINLYYELSNDQERDLSGIDYLLTQMVLKGDTQNYTSTEIAELKRKHGIQFNSLAAHSYGAFSVKFYKEDVKLAGQLLQEIVFASKLEESVFKEEQKALYTKLSSISDEEKIMQTARQNYYGSHLFRTSAKGTAESIRQIDFPTLQTYYEQTIRNGKITLVVVGDFEKTEVEQALGDLRIMDQSRVFDKLQIPLPVISKKVDFLDSDQGVVVAHSYHQANSTRELVGLHVLQEYLARRLYEVLRREMGLAYTVNVQVEVGDLNTVVIKVVSDEGAVVGETIFKEMRKLLQGDAYNENFNLVVRRFLTNFYLSLEDKKRYADYIGEGLLLGFSKEGLLNFLVELEMPEVELLQEITRSLIKNLSITYVGRYTEEEKIQLRMMVKEFIR